MTKDTGHTSGCLWMDGVTLAVPRDLGHGTNIRVCVLMAGWGNSSRHCGHGPNIVGGTVWVAKGGGGGGGNCRH